MTNWWTLPTGHEWPWKAVRGGGLYCSNSATDAGAYGADAVRIPWRVALDYLWFPEETSRVPLFGEDGRRIGAWGAREYSQRWATSWIQAIRATDPSAGRGFEPGSFPPLKEGVQRLRSDQVLPLLTSLPACTTCPKGFQASPWNGWGSYPIVTTFMVPLADVPRQEMQEWLDFLAQVTFDGCTRKHAAPMLLRLRLRLMDVPLCSFPVSLLVSSSCR